MNRSEALAATPLVRVFRFDHPREEAHHDPVSELSEEPAVNLVESGSFELAIRALRWTISPRVVFLTRPGVTYRYRHFSELPNDVCVSIRYAPQYRDETLSQVHGAAVDQPPVRPLTNRIAYLKWRLLRRAADAETLGTESDAAELLRAAFGEPPRRPPHRPGQLAWYAERIERVRTILEERYAEPHSLSALAREVGMSPFHMARTFQDLIEVSPHRYLVHVRLRRAAERIRGGDRVTPTCYAVGFSDLSHFIRSFRRRFGVSPSRLAGTRTP